MAKHTDDMRAVDQYSFAPIRLEPAHRREGKPLATMSGIMEYVDSRFCKNPDYRVWVYGLWVKRVEFTPDPDILGRVL